MARRSDDTHTLLLLIIGLLSWLIPGAGYYLLNEKRRAIIVFVTISLTFCTGLYIGSIGVIDPIGAKPWYIAQMMNTPLVAFIGKTTSTGTYPVYGKPSEIGQIYTCVSGLLNLLCIVNAVYFAHLRKIERAGE